MGKIKMSKSRLVNTLKREICHLTADRNIQLYYIVEKRDWSIKWDGKYITGALNRQQLIRAEIGRRHEAKISKNKIIHFGSRNLYLPDAYKLVHPSNKVIFTWFHGTDEDVEFVSALPDAAAHANLIHTSCQISRNNLIRWGVPAEKIVVIPLGVDLQLFQPITFAEKEQRRQELGIPEGKTVIGSFQKDGIGWDEGLEPKLIKGPDTFCDTCIEVNRQHPVHALLTGPARGYVKNRLDQAGISYTHICLDDFTKVAWYYPLADICLISSRAEGGPKALLEGMASAVPVVSTRVGMCDDLIRNGENGYLSAIEDVDSLARQCLALISNPGQRQQLIEMALQDVHNLSWERIGERYYRELYQPLLDI